MNNLIVTDALAAYYANIGGIPALTKEKEAELARRAFHENDLKAAREIIMSHLKFVVFIAKKYKNYGLPFEDLVQCGNVGLMLAVEKFDPDFKVRLQTFAVYYIRSEINEYILKNWKILKISTTKSQLKLFYNLRKMKKTIGYSTEAERKEIAGTLDVTVNDVHKMEERMYGASVSYNPSDEDKDDQMNSPENFLYNKNNSPATIIENNDYEEKIMEIIDKMPMRDRDIILSRKFMDEPEIFKTIAERHGISKERVRQIEKRIVNTLKVAVQHL